MCPRSLASAPMPTIPSLRPMIFRRSAPFERASSGSRPASRPATRWYQPTHRCCLSAVPLLMLPLQFFFYTGHGGQAEDEDGDEDDGWDETMCLLDEEMVDDELHRRLVQRVPKGAHLTALMDCCNSYAAGGNALALDHTVPIVTTFLCGGGGGGGGVPTVEVAWTSRTCGRARSKSTGRRMKRRCVP